MSANLGAMCFLGHSQRFILLTMIKKKDEGVMKNMFMHKSLLLCLTISVGLSLRMEITRSKDMNNF